jgi:hypothetical protein
MTNLKNKKQLDKSLRELIERLPVANIQFKDFLFSLLKTSLITTDDNTILFDKKIHFGDATTYLYSDTSGYVTLVAQLFKTAVLNGTLVVAGEAGIPGVVYIYPPTADKGKVAILAEDNIGDTLTVIRVSEQDAGVELIIPKLEADSNLLVHNTTNPFSEIKTAVVDITKADILQLNTAPLEIVPAQGVGTVIELISAIVRYDHATADYGGGGGDILLIDGAVELSNKIASASLFGGAFSAVYDLGKYAGSTLLNEDSPILLGEDNADFTDPGDVWEATLEITVKEVTGGDCEIEINGVTYNDITLTDQTAGTVDDTAQEIKDYFDTNVTTHTVAILGATLTFTSVTPGIESGLVFDKGTCVEVTGVVTPVDPGVDPAEGTGKIFVSYRVHDIS